LYHHRILQRVTIIMEYAVIDTATGDIVNRALLGDGAEWHPPDGHEIVQDDQRVMFIGGKYVGGQYTAPISEPPPPPPVPQVISRRQFFQQAAILGTITQDEALAAVATGAIPSTLQTIINGLPADQQFNARMLVTGAAEFKRDHPLALVIGAALNLTSAQMDGFWAAAALQ